MNKRLNLSFITIVTALVICGCTVGPNYKKPAAAVPGSFRGLAPEDNASNPRSLGDQKWIEVFQDEQLRSLIRTALQQNYDLQLATERLEFCKPKHNWELFAPISFPQ